MTLRLLRTGVARGAFNMGLDEAVLGSVAEGRQPPTLRFYGWNPPTVSLGYFQGLDDEVDREACRAAGVDVVRRITGGGAVFHDDELTYSVVIPERHPLARADIMESYRFLCSGLVDGLARLGLRAEFAPLNDILVDGRKVSGNAQTRRRGCILQHGTVLLGVDPERMFGLLKVPSEKLKGKLIQDIKDRVRGLDQLLGRLVGFDEAADALAAGFAAALGVELSLAEPTADELAEAERHAEERYANEAWTSKR